MRGSDCLLSAGVITFCFCLCAHGVLSGIQPDLKNSFIPDLQEQCEHDTNLILQVYVQAAERSREACVGVLFGLHLDVFNYNSYPTLMSLLHLMGQSESLLGPESQLWPGQPGSVPGTLIRCLRVQRGAQQTSGSVWWLVLVVRSGGGGGRCGSPDCLGE